MGSARGQDGSLGSGISLPQWMKGKIDNRFDFDDSSFSPPSHDDSFFYIRYPKSTEETRKNSASGSQEGYRPISQLLNENKSTTSSGTVQVASSSSGSTVTQIKDVGNIDFSKHPLPCQPFIPTTGENSVKPPISTIASKYKAAKSQGTDDGFHSEPALCGKSIVHVANRIMSRKVTKPDAAGNDATETKNAMEPQLQDQFLTKGSKSLPVTPIASPISTPDHSPKLNRRAQANRYFAGNYGQEKDGKYQTGWILSSIFGNSRDVMAHNKIQEEDEESPSGDAIPFKYLNRKKSISSQNLSYLGTSETSSATTSSQQQEQLNKSAVYTNVFKAKPSELREMNFWSPTSM